MIISKLDYVPLSKDIKYDGVLQEFYIDLTYPQESPTTSSTTTLRPPATTTSTTTLAPLVIRKKVDLTDGTYFCNKSWTLSYNINTQSWVSFHSYIPNYYIAENNFFYSGINEGCDLEAIAAIEVQPSTTTSTTTVVYNCGLAGTAYIPNCDISGFALGTTTTTSTTTTIAPDCSLEGTAIEE